MKKVGVLTSCIMDLTYEVSELPKPGQTVSADEFHTGYGGKGANQAVAAGRTGADVRVIGAVGEDDFGQGTIRNFEENGIDASQIFQFEEAGTGLASIYVDEAGENAIGVAPRANLELTPEHVEAIDSEWFDVDIIGGVLELNSSVLAKGFRRAKQTGGAKTVLNAAPAAPLPDELWELTDVLIVNETEAEFYTDELPTWKQPGPALDKLKQTGAEVVILTLGEAGAVISSRKGIEKIPGKEVDPVDTTGAGDAFIGRYLSSLASDNSQVEAVRAANDYAARSVLSAGTQKSFPTAE